MARRSCLPSPIVGALAETSLRDELIGVVSRGLVRFDQPVTLASGVPTREFIDGKAALARGNNLELACRAVLECEGIRDSHFDAVGGLTMGADALAHGVALLSQREWFSVRKEPKGRGTNKWVEGAQVAGKQALLVDDVVTSGGSIQKAYEVILDLRATVVGAVALVDRGDVARDFFSRKAVPYHALVTYRDLGIEPIRPELAPA